MTTRKKQQQPEFKIVRKWGTEDLEYLAIDFFVKFINNREGQPIVRKLKEENIILKIS